MNNFERWYKQLNGKDIRENIERLKEARTHFPYGSEEYERITDELMKEYELLKKYRDSRFGIEPKALATLIVIGGIAFFAICLDQESPKAIKLAQFVCKLFRVA